MHADAGQRRRRRILLLFQRRRIKVPAAEMTVSVPEPEPPVSEDNEYLSLCQTDTRCSLVVEDESRQLLSEQALTNPVLTIGRSPENDVWLDEDWVRPRHLLVVWLPGGLFFTSMSSTAEIRGPGGPVKSGWWTPGTVLRIGAFHLRLNNSPKPSLSDDPLAVSPQLEAELPRLELQFTGSKMPKRPWPVTRMLTLIGRSSVCKIRLDHERILPVHALLVRTAGRLWLINLAEPDRTLVNDAPVCSTPLDVGDRVTFGDFGMEVQAAAEWPAVTPMIALSPEPAEERSTTNVEQLLQQFTAQQQKILEAQQRALQNLERLTKETSDPAQLKAALDEMRHSCETLGTDQARMQEELERNLRSPSE